MGEAFEGVEEAATVENAWNDHVFRVKNQIIAKLRDGLGGFLTA
jgi:hypothetical protein